MSGAALALALLALLLAGFAVVQVFRLSDAVRALSRVAFPVPAQPAIPWPPPPGADANAVAAAALANAPDLFSDARRQQAIIDAAGPSPQQLDVMLQFARASTCPDCGAQAGSRPAEFGEFAHHNDGCELMALLRDAGVA